MSWTQRSSSRPPRHIRVVTPGVPAGPLRWFALAWTLRWRPGSGFSSSWPGYLSRKSNVIVRIAGGKWRWRFDLCNPEYKLIIEYDGRQHAYDAGQWSHDLERREWLDQDGWRLLVVISDGIYGDPLRTLQRVRSALEERGARVPKSFKQEWTRHFMARS
jgi:very-short-patch-repair endonuclease